MNKKEKDIEKKINDLYEKIDRLEKIIREISKPYEDMVEYIEYIKGVSSRYLRILDLYLEHGVISPEIIVPDIKDPISKEIVKILFEKGELNISEIAREIKKRRGTSSRKTIREKLLELKVRDVVKEVESKKGKIYKISDHLITEWLEMLGILKEGDHK
ncbi:MAG: transcriptional regulator [Candidatus Hydrothermarchaeota archaeon]